MESKVCMNAQCGAASTSGEWRRGWSTRSGELVLLCDKCGSAYEQSIFCDVFHTNESGWRGCSSCDKRLHCGCIAARFMIELLDNGGVSCISCAKKSGILPVNVTDDSNGIGVLKLDSVGELCSLAAVEHTGGAGAFERTNLKQLLQFQSIGPRHSVLQVKQEETLLPAKLDVLRQKDEEKDMHELSAQPNLSISLGPSLKPSPFHDVFIDERGKTTSIFQLAPRSRQLLPKPAKSAPTAGMEANGSLVSQIHVARPPPEGRGKTQLLPRYWPRITDQELQQISGHSNSKIIPLFEKVLSASDAGRIGRLVLPKACAEAYFPSITQPEGLPLKIHDTKGKEWVFQFRFWPNNNSRMYVLEGVTPCIQSMQLQAGDTVTFSRTEPEGKLVMGFRKATNSTLSQSFKGSSDTHLSVFNNSNLASGDINWLKLEKPDDMTKENLLLQSVLVPARKRARNIGCKSKRLLIDSLDALELRLTWEEAQELLRPSPSAIPSIVTIEDHDFEEYEEPPVFGKRSLFVSRPTGEYEQWAQCDACGKWRRLPVETLLPPKWSCTDNISDPGRSSCSAPDELSPREQETLIRLSKEYKRKRMASSNEKLNQEKETSSALETLANAAAVTNGESAGEGGVITVAATTKHPRHRPGCSCIVCSQPPSGKGKHKPSCTCTVCEAVKRRFKTLMMRKRKNQTTMTTKEEEGETGQASQQTISESRDETEVESRPKNEELMVTPGGGGNIDLNYNPGSKEGPARVSMMSLLQAATFPLESYLKQKNVTSAGEQQQTVEMVSMELGSTSSAAHDLTS
ncbi:PREDICTED: B3 domain-containing transcription repressor VAL2 [Tarenaya hassleriana]|uniref:B3 domain-containing transcription repressor VAL2 n=1 Tax=Tarenaya hassleriana TaxID=28532 RepID=UPI00053CA247|nr:PREDICTED: B3 domain-containing transcription repressor VAL2 [Tarenaya hassleriana]